MAGYFERYANEQSLPIVPSEGVGTEGAAFDGAPLAHRASPLAANSCHSQASIER